VVLAGLGSATWFGPDEFVRFHVPGQPIGLLVFLCGGAIIVLISAQLAEARKRIMNEAERLRESEGRLETEIAEHRRTDAEVKRLSRRNSMILESAGEGIWGVDTSGIVTFINRTGAADLGYEPEELVGKPSHRTWHRPRSARSTRRTRMGSTIAERKPSGERTGPAFRWISRAGRSWRTAI
jgi:PAS domain S-box-containing protein